MANGVHFGYNRGAYWVHIGCNKDTYCVQLGCTPPSTVCRSLAQLSPRMKKVSGALPIHRPSLETSEPVLIISIFLKAKNRYEICTYLPGKDRRNQTTMRIVYHLDLCCKNTILVYALFRQVSLRVILEQNLLVRPGIAGGSGSDF